MMNIIRNHDTVKNSIEEEYDIPQNLDLLNKWTIPKIDPKIIYKFEAFERIGLKQVVLPNTQDKATNIVQTPEGNVVINFDKPRYTLGQKPGSRFSRSNSSYYHISPPDYEVKSPSRFSTSQIRETEKFSDDTLPDTVEELRIHPDNIVRGVYKVDADMTASEINFFV